MRRDEAKVAAREAWIKELEKPKAEQQSLRKFAEAHGVDPTTLGRLAKGGKTIREHNEERQILSKAEERTIVDFLLEMGDRGFPLTHRLIIEKAQYLLQAKGHDVEIGQEWIYRFLNRHPDLKTYRATPLHRTRANGLNPTQVKNYWDTVEELFDKFQPPPGNIFGMDEVGINTGVAPRQIVIGRRGQRVQHQQTEGDKENITVITTICADGTMLDDTVVFKGTYMMKDWALKNPDNAK